MEVRIFKDQDLDQLMEIWLRTNLEVHSFIDRDFWLDNFEEVKGLIGSSRVYVVEEDRKILGFIGLVDGYIAGIFIDSNYRSQGLGRRLIDRAKEDYDLLYLDVFKKNSRALKFYKDNGFFIVAEAYCEDTDQVEISMEFRAI